MRDEKRTVAKLQYTNNKPYDGHACYEGRRDERTQGRLSYSSHTIVIQLQGLENDKGF